MKVSAAIAPLMAGFRQCGITADPVCKGYEPGEICEHGVRRGVPAVFFRCTPHEVCREYRAPQLRGDGFRLLVVGVAPACGCAEGAPG